MWSVQGFARAFKVMLSAPSAFDMEEKFWCLEEGQVQGQGSTTKYKSRWEKLKKEKEIWGKEREEWLKEKEDLNYWLEDAYIQLEETLNKKLQSRLKKLAFSMVRKNALSSSVTF